MEQGLNIKGTGIYHIQGAAKWCKIIAIITSIMMALMVIAAFRLMSISVGAGIIYLIVPVIYLFPIMMSFGFSNHINAAIANNDENELETGLSNLRSLATFMGVLAIIGLIFFIIAVIGIIVGGSKAGLF